MSTESLSTKPIEKIVIRFFFAFFLLQVLPLNPAFYVSLFTPERETGFFFMLFSLVNYVPGFIAGQGSTHLYDILILAVSLVLTGYLFLKYTETEADVFFRQLLRIILRYKLAAVLFTYAFIKIFPQQVPFPTLSELNTPYGDFIPAKIFELTVGVARANYQTAIGLTELLAAILLLFRRTATLGAIVAVGTLLNIVLAAFAYDTGDQDYSLYLMVIALILTAYHLPTIFRLMMEKPGKIGTEKLTFHGKRKQVRLVLKSVFIFILVIYAAASYSNRNNLYLIPQAQGLKDAYGLYDVQEFRLNNEVIPYSRTDSNRWQNVVFEKWATLSVKKAQLTPVDSTKHQMANREDIDRSFESSGTTGRYYYAYRIDSAGKKLYLKNKNRHLREEELVLEYSRPDSSTLVLSGAYSSGDSIRAVLKKVNKKYLLIKGRRKPLEL